MTVTPKNNMIEPHHRLGSYGINSAMRILRDAARLPIEERAPDGIEVLSLRGGDVHRMPGGGQVPTLLQEML